MKAVIACLGLLLSAVSMAKDVIIPFEEFSTQYRADIVVDSQDTNKSKKSGVVRVYEKSSNLPIIEMQSNHLDLDIDDGALEANILNLPSGLGSVLVYDDFDRDGLKDFAIMDGQDACYGGPSYALFKKEQGRYAFDKSFKNTARKNCGFYADDEDENVLHVTTKIGCCQYLLETYRIDENHQRKIWKTSEIALDNTLAYEIDITKEFDTSGTMIKRTRRAKLVALEDKNFQPTLAFDLKDGDTLKTLYLFELNNGQLDIAVTEHQTHDVSESLRLAKNYPSLATKSPAVFTYDEKQQRLCFHHHNTTYSIIDDAQRTGILISQSNSSQFISMVGGKQGELKNITKSAMANVVSGACY